MFYFEVLLIPPYHPIGCYIAIYNLYGKELLFSLIPILFLGTAKKFPELPRLAYFDHFTQIDTRSQDISLGHFYTAGHRCCAICPLFTGTYDE